MKKITYIVIIILILIGGYFVLNKKQNPVNTQPIKIGIVTDLTGPASYWGESTKAGADILAKEFLAQGKNVNFVFEDYALDAPKAVSAVQKLINADKVNAVYAEFNPGAIAVASFLKDKQIPFIYDAAVVSPLKDNKLFYKTYLDYQEGCKQIAQKFKDEGVTKIGLLKVNLEFGELCQSGITEVYGDNKVVEGYNLGDTDFRTQLLKIKTSGAQAVINVGFEGDTSNTLKIIKDLKYTLKYGTVDDTITQNILNTYGSELKGAWTFGFPDPSKEFQNKLKNYKISSPYGAAIAYTHLKQLVNALENCVDKDVECIAKKINDSQSDSTIGFKGFNNRIAELDMKIKNY